MNKKVKKFSGNWTRLATWSNPVKPEGIWSRTNRVQFTENFSTLLFISYIYIFDDLLIPNKLCNLINKSDLRSTPLFTSCQKSLRLKTRQCSSLVYKCKLYLALECNRNPSVCVFAVLSTHIPNSVWPPHIFYSYF
jgi:hypothetical protein